MSEATVLKKSMLSASSAGAKVFRNNVGIAFQPNGQVIKYGLCNGSSDLIGWVPVTITQDMVGLRIAQFLAIECKDKKGRATQEQENFLSNVREGGGIGIITKTGDDVEQLIKNRSKK